MRVRVANQDVWRPIGEVTDVLEKTVDTVLRHTLNQAHVHARSTNAAALWAKPGTTWSDVMR